MSHFVPYLSAQLAALGLNQGPPNPSPGVGDLLHNPLIAGLSLPPELLPSEAQLAEWKERGLALWQAKEELGNEWPHPWSDTAIDAIATRAEEIFEVRKRARQRHQKAQQRQRQRRTLQRCLDAIVWGG